MWIIPKLIRWGVGLALLGFLLFVYTTYGCMRIQGDEMARTDKVDAKFPRGKYKMVYIKARTPALLDRGDVVFFDYQHGSHSTGHGGQLTFLGRIVGLPGDRVRMEKGKTRVNGQYLAEGYVDPQSRSDDDVEEILVPLESFFILCDNRMEGRKVDSRAIGPVGTWAILGRVSE